MSGTNLEKYLNDHHVRYMTLAHSPAYTSQEIASVTHIPGKELAKTVMIIIDGRLQMAVLPASQKIDFMMLKKKTKANEIMLASEEEFKYQFPDCETGAMPPFGNLYHMDMWVEKGLTEDDEIFFNAGTHKKLIKMSFKDFKKLTKPHIVTFAMKKRYH